MFHLRKNELSVPMSLLFIPFVPFLAVNLLVLISQVKFRHFVLTTGRGIFPGEIIFTSIRVGLGHLFEQGVKPNLFLLCSP